MALLPLPRPAGPPRAAHPLTGTAYQLVAAIDGPDPAADWTAAVGVCLRWANRRLHERLPTEAWAGGSAEVSAPGERLECVALPADGLWTMRLEHPDGAVPGRVWTADAALARRPDGLTLAVRVAATALPAVGPPPRSTPRVVRELAHRLQLADNWRLNQGPWEMTAPDQLDALQTHVAHPQRFLPVVVVADGAAGSLDPRWLADQAVGLAHVVWLSADMARVWAAGVGTGWGVEPGGVRTYQPGLSWDDPPAVHPHQPAARVAGWPATDDDPTDAHPFAHYLIGRLRQRAADRRVDWTPCVFATVARTRRAAADRKRADESRQSSAGDAEWKGLYEAELAQLHTELDERGAETQRWVVVADQAEKERDKTRDEARRLRHQLDGLRALVRQRTGGGADDAIPIPDTFDGLPEWAEEHLAGRLSLHPRALRGLKQADYEDPALVYRALLLLADDYRDCCLGNDGAADRHAAGLARLGLGDGRSISTTRAGEQGDDYKVRYPTPDGPKRLLERHLTKGTSKHTSKCLRVYYFWDADEEKIVVGWLPSHLDTRAT